MQKMPLQFSRQKFCSVLLLTLESDVAEQTNFSWTSLASSIKRDKRVNAFSHVYFEDRFPHGCLSKIVTRIAIAVYMYNKIVDQEQSSVFVCLFSKKNCPLRKLILLALRKARQTWPAS